MTETPTAETPTAEPPVNTIIRIRSLAEKNMAALLTKLDALAAQFDVVVAAWRGTPPVAIDFTTALDAPPPSDQMFEFIQAVHAKLADAGKVDPAAGALSLSWSLGGTAVNGRMFLAKPETVKLVTDSL